MRSAECATTVIGPLSLVIGQGPGTGNGEQKTRQRRAGSWPVARRSPLAARGFLDSGDKGPARGGQAAGLAFDGVYHHFNNSAVTFFTSPFTRTVASRGSFERMR